MKKHARVLTTSAFILACGVITGSAQQTPGAPMQQPTQTEQQSTDQDGCGMMGHRWVMGHGMMGHGWMMERGMMGHGSIMGHVAMRIIFALMDSDGDGTVSLQEFQAAHERIFKAMDTNKDGTITLQEMEAFMHGTTAPQQHQ